MLRRALLWTLGCGVAALALPRLFAAKTPLALPPPLVTKPSATKPQPPLASDATVQRYRAAADHQFYVTAMVNGIATPFIVDTGATLVALGPEDAERLGFGSNALRFDVPIATANGTSVAAAITLAELRLGDIAEYNVPALVRQRPGGLSLLGMSFLARLKSWRIAEDVLTIAR